MSVGQLHRPALPSPRRQEWDDKGKALGVKARRSRKSEKDRYPKGQDKHASPFGLVSEAHRACPEGVAQ
nr:MAG TPA: hypothetical protein [Inoviridae sp.]